MFSPPAPSGFQVSLVYGEQRADVVEVGGAIRAYTVSGRAVLDGYTEQERCTGARGQSLIPWPNRLRDGKFELHGQPMQLPLTEPEKHNAIHGLARWASWAVADQTKDAVAMAYRIPPQSGWPGMLDLTIAYSLDEHGLTVRTTATNVGPQSCPYGAGAHPYLSAGDGTVDRLRLTAPGRRRMLLDEQGIPTGTEDLTGGPYDFRDGRTVGDVVLDTGYQDLVRDDRGRAVVTLVDANGVGARLWMDASYGYLMLFTGDSLANTDRRRRGLGVEPMTCAPDALNSGEGLQMLAPGASASSEWGITPLTYA